MRKGRSTGKPTQAEAARIVAAKEGPCIPCLSWSRLGNMPEEDVEIGGDYDHKKSGNVRRGHLAGFCSCGWHHRRIVPYGWTHAEMTKHYGPSLMDGSKLFASVYGSDDELIALQTEILGG